MRLSLSMQCHSGPTIWLIGGTSDSAAIAHQLSEHSLPYVVTVTTDSASSLYPEGAHVCVGALNPQSIQQFMMQWQIKCILDASHPFACEISRLAMACSERSAIAYLRYERDDICPTSSRDSAQEANQGDESPFVSFADSIDDLVAGDLLKHKRILFSLGYRHLYRFASLRQTSQLFARVLPSVEAVEGAIAAGFSPGEIIALRPPVSPALESALWQQWNITCVVAKASGHAGGELIKRQIAQYLGVELVLLQRPSMAYLAQTSVISEMVDFAAKMVGSE